MHNVQATDKMSQQEMEILVIGITLATFRKNFTEAELVEELGKKGISLTDFDMKDFAKTFALNYQGFGMWSYPFDGITVTITGLGVPEQPAEKAPAPRKPHDVSDKAPRTMNLPEISVEAHYTMRKLQAMHITRLRQLVKELGLVQRQNSNRNMLIQDLIDGGYRFGKEMKK